MIKLIAHRGYSYKYGDNNMKSFKKAIDNKFDMIELDIQICKTGEIVIYHDLYVDNILISSLTCVELQKYNIVMLAEFFCEISPNNIEIFLDIKGDYDFTNSLYILLKKLLTVEELSNVYISGFNRNVIDNLQFYISDNFPIKLGFTTANSFIEQHCDILFKNIYFVCVELSSLTHDFVSYLQSKGIYVFSYTCSNKLDFEHMLHHNIDGIVSNLLLTDMR